MSEDDFASRFQALITEAGPDIPPHVLKRKTMEILGYEMNTHKNIKPIGFTPTRERTGL